MTNQPCLVPDDDEDLEELRIMEKKRLLVTTEMPNYIMIKPTIFPVIDQVLHVCFGNENE